MDGKDKQDRGAVAHKFNLFIAAVIGIATVFIVGVALSLKRAGEVQASAFTHQSSLAFITVFLCYGFVALLLVVFFAYRILSPFGRLLKDMESILSGDVNRRLFLRDRDVFLIKCFVRDVNKLLDRLQSMHVLKDELYRQIHTEGSEIISIVGRDENLPRETRDALTAYHEKVKATIAACKEVPQQAENPSQ